MSIEILRSIRQTEAESDEIKKASVLESRRIISEANSRASELIEKARTEAESRARDLISQAEQEADREKDLLLDKVKEECAELKAQAMHKLDNAVDIIIGRIVKANGNS